MTIATLLDRLDGVQQTASDRWIARCPAHEDRSPSLSVRELPDRRVLLHDFGGCDTGEILRAIGLTMAALHTEPLEMTRQGGGYAPSHSRIPAADLLAVISEEVTTVAIIAADFLEKRAISQDDWNRLVRAAVRIGRARDHVR